MLKKSTAILLMFCGLSMGTGLSYAETLAASNIKRPTPQLITAGQPAEADFVQLKSLGVTKIINLRSEAEDLPFDEKAKAQALGLEYVSLPVAGASGLTRENAERLDALLAGGEKVFLHCASGNRAGALLALRERFIKGASVEDALATGRASGLTSLENAVRAVLQDDSANAVPAGDKARQ